MCYVCLLPALCNPCFWLLKTVILNSPTSPCSLPTHSIIADRTPDRQQKKKGLVACFPSILFLRFFFSVFCFLVFPYGSLRLLIPSWIPPPPTGAGGKIARGPYQTVPGHGLSYQLPGQPRVVSSLPLFPRLAQGGPQFPSLAQRGLLFPCSAQRGLWFPHMAQVGPQFPTLAQRGLLFLHLVQGGPQIPSLAQRGAPVSTSNPDNAAVPECSPGRAFVPECSPESLEAHKNPQPSLPLLPPPPLSSGSPYAHPQPTICAVGSPRVCQSPSASWLEDPLVSASESWTPPRPIDPAAPPWLLAPSSPLWPLSPQSTHPSGSTSVCRRPSVTSGLHSSGCTSSLRLHQAPPSSSSWSSVAPAPPRPSESPPPPRLPEPSALALLILPIALAHRLSVSAPGSSAAVGCPPGVVSPSFTMAPPSVSSTVDSVCCPPPGCPSSSRPSSQVPTRPSLPEDVPSGRGRIITPLDLFGCVFCPHVLAMFLPCLIAFIWFRCVSSITLV